MPRTGAPSARMPPVAGLLLAAGGGRRLGGRAKALLEHQGQPLVVRAAGALRAAGCQRVVVVVGARARDVRALAGLTGCELVENPGWEAGLGSSLRQGLAALADTSTGGALVALVDQPGVGAPAIHRVLCAYRSPSTLASAAYTGRRGHPVLLGAAHFDAVARQAHGDGGARRYLRSHTAGLDLIECGDLADPADIDTPQDLWRLAGTSAERGGPVCGRPPTAGPLRGVTEMRTKGARG